MNELATIEINHLAKRFGSTLALSDVSASAQVGDIIGLIGRNGAGKTTLLETLAGLIMPGFGSSRILSHDSRSLSDEVRQKLGVVFQEDELFGWMKVADHIASVGAHYHNWDRQRAEELADSWSIPLNQRVDSLSRGQRQKLGILLAIVHQPEVLLLDEPASALDPISRRDFLGELVELACDGTRTIVLSSHLLGDVERLAGRIWLMREGELIVDEPLDALKDGVVRLTFQGLDCDEVPDFPQTLNRRRDAWGTVLVAHHPGHKRLKAMQREFGSRLQVSPMNLEQIALEML